MGAVAAVEIVSVREDSRVVVGPQPVLVGAAAVVVGGTSLMGGKGGVAQTLVGLGVDLRQIVTRSTLQAGIAYATGGLTR